MLLKRAVIKGFGKFRDKEFRFKPNLNIIYGPNESGKTTLAKFILSTLSHPDEELERYRPWSGGELDGYVETTDGTFLLLQREGTKLDRKVLETVGFVLEDDELESLRIEKKLFEANLMKRTEKTDEGRIFKTVLSRLEGLDFRRCFERLNSQYRLLKERIEKVKLDVRRYNELGHALRELKGELEHSENVERQLIIELQKVRQSRTERILEELSQVKSRLETVQRELEKLAWVKSCSEQEIVEITDLLNKEGKLKDFSEQLREEENAAVERLTQINREIEKRLQSLNLVSAADLENANLRVKHLSLLAKMYTDYNSEVFPEDPLWKIFLETPNILERAEEEEKHYREQIDILEGKKAKIQEEIENLEISSRRLRDASIVSTITGVVLFVLSYFLKNFTIALYIFSAASLSLGVLFYAFSKKKEGRLKVCEEELVDISIQRPTPPQVLKILESYGVTNLRQLRRKYEEFLQWKVSNKEKERRLQEMKEIEQEIIRELSKFGVNGAGQMLVSAVERLQQNFSEIQELLQEKENLERRLNNIKNEYASIQKELKSVSETLESTLNMRALTKADVTNYHTALLRFSELKDEQLDLEKKISQLKTELEDEDGDEKVRHLKEAIRFEEKKQSELSYKIAQTEKEMASLFPNFEELDALLKERDEIIIKINALKRLEMIIPNLREHFKKLLERFAQSYQRVFGEEFSGFITFVTGSSRSFVVTPELSLKVAVEGELREPTDYLSGSMKDLIVLGLKLATYKAFYDNNIPLVIDNALIRLDDERLNKVLEFLEKESNTRQIILLTSDKRILARFENSSVQITYLEG
uniref:YhaN AAA domain-containing protein n=1 Tax=Fervidobacterium thailandense TaxID=1008305 RepID=A0A7C5VM89_9BACT